MPGNIISFINIALKFLCPQNGIQGHLVFVLSVRLFMTPWLGGKKTVTLTLAITLEPLTMETLYFIYKLYIWHAYPTNETLSNDTKVNDLVTLTVTFIL